jgi:phosphoglycerate dehydrogenase-like enzyme
MLPHGAVVINVGRGDLIDTGESETGRNGFLDSAHHASHVRRIIDALLEALYQNVSGAALDVTSPEPLPPNHPLFTHPRCIVTPHLSGTVENELDEVVRLCLSSVERMRRSQAPWGIVDVEKGY